MIEEALEQILKNQIALLEARSFVDDEAPLLIQETCVLLSKMADETRYRIYAEEQE